MTQTGRIVKATGGFYYVYTGEEPPIECRARGLFRKQGMSPLVGDMVDIEISPEDGSGYVVEVHPRKNMLIRPPLANLDYMVPVISTTDPAPNLVTIDTYLALLEYQDIPVLIAITKSDLDDAGPLAALYRGAGYPVHIVASLTGEGVAEFTAQLEGKFCAFSGNSGVGKSSLLNAVDPDFAIAVGETSKKLGRGRHTTRHTEIFSLPGGGMVADTPGFSSLDIAQMSNLRAEDLDACFPEFREHLGQCRFDDCRHIHETGCAVRAALESGKIAKSRYQSYVKLHDEIKDIKEWERK